MQDHFTILEKSVLEQFVSGDDVDAKNLQVQLEMLSIESREHTAVGFKTSFSLPFDGVPLLSEDFGNHQANVYADHPQAPAGVAFLLQTENGRIKSLNGYAFVGSWPTNESKFRALKFDYSLINPKVEAV